MGLLDAEEAASRKDAKSLATESEYNAKHILNRQQFRIDETTLSTIKRKSKC